jgi:hypothetical protein
MTVRKPKPRQKVVTLFPQHERRETVSKAFDDTGAKLWTCHGCHEPMGNTRMTLIPSKRPGYSHDIYHQGCTGQHN